MTRTVAPNPALGTLARLLGAWEGDGEGAWGGGAPFRYREWLTFTHNGKPFLAYAQRTVALDDGRPLHGESGYWRAGPDGAVELVVAHPIGVAEIATGRWDGGRLRLRSDTIGLTATAKPVTALERDFELDGDVLRYVVRMATDGGEPRHHLSASLRRAAPG